MLPHEFNPLLEKFGSCDVIDIEENIPKNFDPRHSSLASGACVIVKDREGKLVLIKQSTSRPELDREHWSCVCGRREADEALEETGRREVFEEIGCVVRITGLHHIGNHFVTFDGNKCSLYYGVALFAEIVSGNPKVNSEEIRAVSSFARLPPDFSPRYRKYYPDLF